MMANVAALVAGPVIRKTSAAPGETPFSMSAAATGTEPVAALTSATGGTRHVDLLFTITTLNDVWGVQPAPVASPNVPLPEPSPSSPAGRNARTPYQLAKEVERVVDKVIRPRLALEGGDIEIVEIRDKKVFCRLLGVCAACVGAQQTLNFVVEDSLRQNVDPEIEVIPVTV